jgi:hypothetical protein
MKQENENYNKVLNLLRKSEPVLNSTEDIEREVIKRVIQSNRMQVFFSELVDFLFRWVYIGWVRKSLITVSIALVLVFVYQQGIILRRIDMLSHQTITIEKGNLPGQADEIEKLLMVYKNSGKRFSSKTVTFSEDQIKELLESVNELQIKYKDLENLIDGDPELKKLIEIKLIEKKLIDNNHKKTNL